MENRNNRIGVKKNTKQNQMWPLTNAKNSEYSKNL
jgi:hypothetical protein